MKDITSPLSLEPVVALLLLSTHCPHCTSVLKAITALLKEGKLGGVQIYNLDQHPELAEEHGVRSVPWVRIGSFELTGKQSKSELEGWIDRVSDPLGMAAYFAELIADRQVQSVVSLLQKSPSLFSAVLMLLGDPDTELGVKVGLGVVMEEFAGSDVLKMQIPALLLLMGHDDARIRADACYYLGLTQEAAVIADLRVSLKDENADVRESAEDALDMLET